MRAAPGGGHGTARGDATAAFVVAAGGCVALSAWIFAHGPILATRYWLLGELALWALGWVVATVAALRLPRRRAIVLVVGAAVALRLVALGGPPSTSDDLYRYSWDGRVQSAGVDPYAEPPDNPAVAHLREAWLWPDAAACSAIKRPPGCTRINRPSARTIYPPVAEAWFSAVYRVAGIGAHHKAWQVAGLVTDLGVVALLLSGLRRWGRDPRWVALYALSPAPVTEVVNNGHVDGLAVLLVVAALVVVAPPVRIRPHRCQSTGWLSGPWRDAAAGGLIGAAALVKLFPVVLLVALVGVAGRRRVAVLMRSGAAALAVAGAGYLPHVLAVGPKVLGYLPDYLREEHYDKGGRFLLAGALGVGSRWSGPLSVLALIVVVVWALVRRPSAPVAASAVLGALFLASTPVQPWYAVSLLAVATIAARPAWAVVVVAGYPYFFAVILDNRHVVGIGRAAYGLALAVVVTGAITGAVSSGDRRASRLGPERPSRAGGAGPERPSRAGGAGPERPSRG